MRDKKSLPQPLPKRRGYGRGFFSLSVERFTLGHGKDFNEHELHELHERSRKEIDANVVSLGAKRGSLPSGVFNPTPSKGKKS